MSIIITQLNLDLNRIPHNNNVILIKNKTLWHNRTRQVMRSVNDRQAKVCSAYTDQDVPRANRFTERNPLVLRYIVHF
jgi:hypothetical protein